jgi:hypothetical protein
MHPETAQTYVTYYVTQPEDDRCKRTKEANMPFELIMLLGFFGSALLALLPETADKPVADNFRRGKRQRRRDRGQPTAAGRRHRGPTPAAHGGAKIVRGRI